MESRRLERLLGRLRRRLTCSWRPLSVTIPGSRVESSILVSGKVQCIGTAVSALNAMRDEDSYPSAINLQLRGYGSGTCPQFRRCSMNTYIDISSPPQADAQCPPSTLRSAPVIQELPGDSKKTVGALKSSGAPNRFNNAPAIHIFSKSGFVARSASVMAVLIYPGLSVLTLIPY